MDNTNMSTINENLIPKLKTPGVFYIFAILIVFLIIMMFMIMYDVNLSFKKPKSLEQMISDTFIILFFSLLVVGISILFLPYLKEFKGLLEQIGNVTYIILYTIFAILFYTMISKDILKEYSYIINPAILGLGAFSFYKGTLENYVEKFNINYERIKSLAILFCLISLVFTFNNINSDELSSKYFQYSLILTIISSVFALLYVIILMTLPGEQGINQSNILSNFSYFGVFGSILFILFLITITILISTNKDNLFDNKEKSASIVIMLLVISILWSTLLSINLFSDFTNNITDSSKLDLFKSSLSVLFGIIISGIFIFWITNSIEKQSENSSIHSYMLNALLVIVILGVLYKLINATWPIGNLAKNSFLAMIFNTLLYIPCLVSNLFDFIGKLVSGEYNSTNTSTFTILGIVFGLLISGVFILWITNIIQKQFGDSNIFSFILNALIVIVVLALIFKMINAIVPIGNAKTNAFFAIILNTLLYIPCLVSNLFDFIGKILTGNYNAGPLMMLGVVISLIVAYINISSLFNYVSTQGGKQLVNKPVSTDTEYNLGNYQDLNDSEQFDYQYAISCWVYMDAVGPNTNASYNKFTSLLNFGNKPNILYNGKTHTLMITMQQKNLKDVTKNKLIDFDDNGNRIIYMDKNFLLQKWNNIIINYNGGTLDIFLNGKLVKSSVEVVPYYTFDNLTIGENNGLKGGICNVVYFRNALTSQNVFFLYNTVKDQTIPTLNDSNETIMTSNINQALSSTKKVVLQEN
jgi:hypothetical protein